MVGSGSEAPPTSFHLEDFPPLVVAQVAEGGAVTIGGVEVVVDAGATTATRTMVPRDVTQLNQDKSEWNVLNQSLGFFPMLRIRMQALSYVSSVVGRLLYSDRATTLKQHLEFAKVCIEVDAKYDIPCSVLVDIGNDNLVSIVVEVVWSPSRCKHCMIFRHSDAKRGKVVHDVAVGSAPHGAPVELDICSQDSVSFSEDRVAGENGAQSLSVYAEAPNKFATLSVVNEEECGIQVAEPELDNPKK
ncbi:hypothetical protein V6N13_133324 [Hibiscus sabdariffa]|uniref:Uncharacterized protein n=1 Tax=Hibiscus sabdariffa TaxID=183260 RepID=A0ABR2CII1_9ROSI